MQASLEAEVKGKQEALRVKKKIEADINELEMSLDHANKANAEEQKQLKRYANTLMEIETAVQEEMRIRADIEDQAGIAERRGNALAGELEEARMLLDTAERSRKSAELEVAECRENINDLSYANTNLSADKRHMESVLKGQQQELESLMLRLEQVSEVETITNDVQGGQGVCHHMHHIHKFHCLSFRDSRRFLILSWRRSRRGG